MGGKERTAGTALNLGSIALGISRSSVQIAAEVETPGAIATNSTNVVNATSNITRAASDLQEAVSITTPVPPYRTVFVCSRQDFIIHGGSKKGE